MMINFLYSYSIISGEGENNKHNIMIETKKMREYTRNGKWRNDMRNKWNDTNNNLIIKTY